MKMVFANIYAPNLDTPHFFQVAFNNLEKFTPNYTIIDGDMNCSLTEIDRKGSICNNDKSANWLNSHLENGNYVDLWRYFYPEINGYTYHRSRPRLMFSRLDYWFISEAFVQFIDKVELIPGFKTDHTIVQFICVFELFKRGPGYWKLNSSLLLDTDYVDRINDIIDRDLVNVQKGQFGSTWEVFKLTVRGSSIQFAANKKKSKKNMVEVLERKLKKLEKELIDKPTLFANTEEQIRLIKHELSQIVKDKTKGAMIRSRANWNFFGEKPTKYFLNLEKSNATKRILGRVRNEKRELVTGQKEVLDEIKNFYADLYTSRGIINKEYVEKLRIPKIPVSLSTELDEAISLTEISQALKELKNDKTLGTDGFTANFLKIFWNKLKHFIQGLLEEVIENRKFHLTARRGVLSLLEKHGKDMTSLKSWRPLTLLNTENKLFTKILA